MDTIKAPYTTFAHYKVGKGYATLSISVDNGECIVGCAYSHPRDHFNKSIGRKIALGRREKQSINHSFEFSRNDSRLSDQVRDEFEKFVLTAALARTKNQYGFGESGWVGPPPWVIHSMIRDIRRQSGFTRVESMVAIEGKAHAIARIKPDKCEVLRAKRFDGPSVDSEFFDGLRSY